MESQLVHPVRGRLRPLQENAWKCAIPNDEVENLPRMDSALGVLLDGNAVKPFFFGGFYPRSRKVYGYEIRFQWDG